MGYTHGKEWNEESTKEAIMEIVNSLKLKHFPSKSQIIAFCGNNALAKGKTILFERNKEC